MTNPSDFGLEPPAAQRLDARSPHCGGAVLTLPSRNAREGAVHDRNGSGAPAAQASVAGGSLDGLLAAARPRMYAVALRMTKNHDDAEDVVQEAMLKAWRSMAEFQGRAAFSTWTHRIVVNTALDKLRARRPEISSHTSAGGNDDDDPSSGRTVEQVSAVTPEDLVGGAEVGAAVHRALDALSPVHRDALALRELDGESYRSIARIVRCPIGTVMSRLHHARHRLAEEIDTRYRELHPQAA
jgi:RNA polymerase sigma-70 factor (ECF subfamily)